MFAKHEPFPFKATSLLYLPCAFTITIPSWLTVSWLSGWNLWFSGHFFFFFFFLSGFAFQGDFTVL
jgi:hypothetical protein